MLLTPVQLLSRVLLALFLILRLGKMQSRTVIYVLPLTQLTHGSLTVSGRF